MKTFLLSLFLFLGSLPLLAQSDYDISDEPEVTTVIASFVEYDGENYVFETELEEGTSTLYFANVEEDIFLEFDFNTEEFAGKNFEVEYITEEVQGDDEELESESKTIINLILK